LWPLHLLDITRKFRTVAIFIIADLQTVFMKYANDLSPFKFLFPYSSFFIIATTIEILIKLLHDCSIVILYCTEIVYKNIIHYVAMPTSGIIFMPIILYVKICQVAYNARHIHTRRSRSLHEPDSSYLGRKVCRCS
jgi:hypothetical protein